MPLNRSSFKVTLLALALLIALTSVSSRAQQSRLGKVDFPTSGSEKAKTHFMRGIAALHSFWYEEALDAFRESTRVDPDFLMGYWGEAMAHNHPLWSEQDMSAAKKVLEKIKDVDKVTPRERAYINAVRALYGEGDKLARDMAYSAAMEKIYKDYPEDLEAASFYALSLLGIVRPDDRGYRNQARAGAIALDVYQKNPDHPGAAHYIIHAFDDPEHAILALPAARRYAEIAPEAHHARHMPSHIFLQLGMWPEAAASNESAWGVSDEWVKRKSLSDSHRDYHSLHWLTYIYLQQGRYSKAEQLLALMRKAMTEATDDRQLRPGMYANNYADMVAAFVVETQRWEMASKLFDAPRRETERPEAGAMEHAHGAAPVAASNQTNTRRMSNRSQTLPVFVSGLAAARSNSADAEKSLARLREMGQPLAGAKDAMSARMLKVLEIRQLEVAAAASSARGSHDEAIAMMKKATAMEEEMAPPSGPPGLIKPSHELFGEVLLRAGRPKEAAQQFAASLLRQPNRARSLLGAARAAAQMGDKASAQNFYSTFLRIWQQADQNLPELREAQQYMGQASAR
jgi:tetratricopeptide (TPR) repeat protein